MQRKTWYSILGVDAMPLSIKNLLLRKIYVVNLKTGRPKKMPSVGEFAT
jgi:hypothetical protein